MKKILLIIILSFLVIINIRMWGMRDASSFVNNHASRRSICDIECQKNERREDDFNHSRSLARQVVYMKHCKKEPCSYNVSAQKRAASNIPSYMAVEHMLHAALIDFAYHPSCNEFTLQQLIDLMCTEKQLLSVFIYPTSGNQFDILQKRSALLEHAIPTVRMLFDKIINLATYNELLNDQYLLDSVSKNRDRLLLSTYDKKIFLHTAFQRIADIQKQIKNMQQMIALQ